MTGRWKAASTFLLRQAGFPADLMAMLHDPSLREEHRPVLAADAAVEKAAARALDVLPVPSTEPLVRSIRSRIGSHQPIRADVRAAGEAQLTGEERAVVREYHAAVEARDLAWATFTASYARRLDDQRRQVLATFRDDVRLRDALLISNDDQYPLFNRWLTQAGTASTQHRERARADLFTMYLQRVSTKNETNSHFGPVSVGRFDEGSHLLSWQPGPADRRFAYFSHWAAEEIGRALARRPELRPDVRPRRHPLALLTPAGVRCYESATTTGLAGDWGFVERPLRPLTAAERWLFAHADGERTLRALHAGWADAPGQLPDVLDEALVTLTAEGLVFAHFAVPVGEPEPLGALRHQLRAAPAAADVLPRIEEMERLVGDFAQASHDRRAEILPALKAAFTELTGAPASRNQGRHYADRGVLHEECLAPLTQVTAGTALRTFVTDELSVVYDLLLAGPRHRMRREGALLASWFAGRFGGGAEVPLREFYRQYFADRDELIRQCRPIEDEVSAIDADLVALLSSGNAPDGREIVVEAGTVESFLARYPRTPAAICNPDLMLAARSREALDAGDFLAVVGDCHAMRDLLTHTCLGPLVATEQPSTTAEILDLYRGIVADDEVLCDVIRSHLDKSDVQLELDTPDVEFLGRSPKPRGSVIVAAELSLRHRRDRLELRAPGHDGPLRLLAPPATGPSITRDPLAVFSFPRYFGGVTIRGGDAAHLPRIRYGRVVLQRELWRVPCAELEAGSDARGFHVIERVRRRYGLPRLVFAKPPGEPKPIFVDFESPLLLRQLLRLCRKREGTVLMTEMLPDPDQLWLDIDGRRYTSEVRLAVFG